MTSAMSSQGRAVDNPPAILKSVGIDQHLNYQLPLDLTFTDDAGKQVPLSTYFGKVPAIFLLVYYRCPMLCSEELEGLTSALKMMQLPAGQGLQHRGDEYRPGEATDRPRPKKRST